jgi:hypothetical protein
MALALPVVLGHVLAWALASVAFRIIAAMGVGVVTYIGVGELLESALAEIQSLTAGLGAYVLQAMVLMRIDDAITVIFSAMAGRVAMKAFGPAGAIGSFFVRPPTAP